MLPSVHKILPLLSAMRLAWLTPALLLTLPAQAANDAASSATTTLPEVIVKESSDEGATEGSGSYTTASSSTATKLPLTLRETPQSVTVVTREKMDDFNQNNINQVLESTPGVTVEKIETDRTYYTSRGFDITNFQVDGIGMPLTNGNMNGDVDTAIYDRVEVVRGATGLMTGAGEPSATINMVRKRPTKEFQAEVKGGAGSWDNGRAEVDISGSLMGSEKLRGRMVAVKQDANSYLDRYAVDKSTLYGVVEGDITESTLLTVGYHLQKNNSDSPLWGALPLYYSDGSPTNYDRSTSTATDWSYWNVENQRLFAELKQSFSNGWQVKGVYTHVETKQDSRLFYVYGTPNRDTGLGLYSYPSLYQQQHKQNIVDINASGPFQLWGREHQLVLGSSLAKAKVNELSLYSSDLGTPLPDLSNWNGAYPQPEFNLNPNGSQWDEQEASAYLAARFSLLDRLSWIVGSRLSSWESEGTSYGVAKTNSAHGKLSPYTGLVYDLNDQLSTYASYTTIFKPQKEVDINRNRLDPIDGISYETGVKGEYFEGQLNTTVALFQSKQNNVAEASGTLPGSNDFYYTAQDGVRSQGYELEATGMLLPEWQLAAGYTKLSIKDGDGHTTRTYTPKQQFKLSSTYQLAQWKLGGSLRWQDDIYRTNNLGGQTKQKSYALLDLMARYDINRHFYTALNLNNVTNEKYLTSLYWDQGYYGAPRNFMLTAGWKY